MAAKSFTEIAPSFQHAAVPGGCTRRLLPASIPAPSVGPSLGNSLTSISPPARSCPGGSQGVPRRARPPVAGTEPRTTQGRGTRHHPRGVGGGGWGVHARAATPTLPPPPPPPEPQPGLASPRLPPAGPKTAGAAAPVAAAARSWRARAAAAAAAASTSPSGCLGRPRPACGAPARPPSRPPAAAAATAAAAPSPTRAAHAARRTAGARRASLVTEQDSAGRPLPPQPHALRPGQARPGQPPAALLRRREGPALRARVGVRVCVCLCVIVCVCV